MNAGISYEKVRERFKSKGYKFYTEAYDLNIFGIRSANKDAGEFDDFIGVAFRNASGISQLVLFKGTTDPSDQCLLKPLHKDGTLILEEGQFPGAYKLGIHGRSWASGGYKALEQIKPMRYVRDNTKDTILDTAIKYLVKKTTGVFKTNIHRASKSKIVDRIGSYSAGCQVIQDPNDFDHLIRLCEAQIRVTGINSFTYTLLNEKDFV